MLIIATITVLLIIITTVIHAIAMISAIRLVQHHRITPSKVTFDMRVLRVSGIVVLMFMASLIESAIWAIPYVALDLIGTLEEAVYFSMVTYTTLGYGEIVIQHENWRLLASFEAATGIIMFGWTTAIVMAAIHQVYFGARPLISTEEQ